jgi:hypothetical protein
MYHLKKGGSVPVRMCYVANLFTWLTRETKIRSWDNNMWLLASNCFDSEERQSQVNPLLLHPSIVLTYLWYRLG